MFRRRNLACGICLDSKLVSEVFKDGKCSFYDHAFCPDCISKHVETLIRDNDLFNMTCPDPNCFIELEPESFRALLPREVIDRWEIMRCESMIDWSEKFYCPFKECSGLLVDDGREVVTSAECPYCHRLFCAQCKVPWHADMSCGKFQRSKKDPQYSDDNFFKLAKSEKWQKCPQCCMYVQKTAGCIHMICRCGCDFCYSCGMMYREGHKCRRSFW
ncbi:hypothetical protein LR48_Vigan09g123100 [Vigna angularis]|uniref:RBR-type E3 ubiquitin transferase n=1 Tax=Phaseolus angularis TaxID=3914 RepID=A0A0L9VCD3_PHAAN|nr:hypothetical protein LR48_Vigan09g123100 [Vigna angularis]